MSALSVILTASVAANLFIGTAVLLTNRARVQNRAFFLFALNLALWSGSVFAAVEVRAESWAAQFIRYATALGLQIALSMRLLFLSIFFPRESIRQLLGRMQGQVLATEGVAALSFTPLVVRGVEFHTSAIGVRLPIADTGPLFEAVHVVTFVSCFVVLGHFGAKVRSLEGIRRTEMHYVFLGIAVATMLIAITNLYLPMVRADIVPQRYGPLPLLVLNGIIAYGIATQKVMDVSVVLRRLIAYVLLLLYLVVLYGMVVFISGQLPLIRDVPQLPPLLGALALAYSMAPMRGVFQELSYKLSINRKPFSIEGAIKSGHSLFASITTTDALIERFRNIVLTAGIDAETIRVFLPRHNLFIEHLPEASHRSPQCLRRTRPLVKILRAHRRPIAAYSVNRTRPSQTTAALGKDLAEMDAQVALGLYSKNELKGMVTMAARRSGRIYSATDQDALQVLCDQLAVAIENAQLYTEVQNNKIYNDILVDNLVSGLIAANQEGLITIMNREAQRIADLSAPRALGSRLDVLPEPFAGALRQTLDKANPIKEQEAVIERNDREPIPVRMGSSPFFSSTGEPLGALLVFADLSEQKKLESQVRRSDRLASVGTLSAGMAHEIKNPLVTIKTFAELLPERFQDKEFRETFSSLVSHEVQRIDRLVNQLLHFARPAQADLRPASLHATVQSAMVLIEEQLHRNHIRLELNLHAENDGILGDENLLSQALINLLFNAIDSMESGGTLAVETRHTPLPWPLQEQAGPHPPDGRIYLCLSIRDSGSGIAKDALGQIFDPFFTTKHHGTGLGLAISHGIIKEHRAVIDVESQLGIGTTFFLYFPLVTPGVTA